MATIATFKTSDLALAVYLSWKGCEEAIPPWQQSTGAQGKPCLEFAFKDVPSELISEFRKDAEGFQRYNSIRRHFLRIAKTELGGNENDSAK